MPTTCFENKTKTFVELLEDSHHRIISREKPLRQLESLRYKIDNWDGPCNSPIFSVAQHLQPAV